MKNLLLTLSLICVLNSVFAIGYIGNEPFFDVCYDMSRYELILIRPTNFAFQKYHASRESAMNEAMRIYNLEKK